MSLYVEHPCGQCQWFEYDSFHDEHYCGNKDNTERDRTDYHFECNEPDKYFKELQR